MIFITGGAHQGKSEYGKLIRDELEWEAHVEVLDSYQDRIRQILDGGGDPLEETSKIIEGSNPKIIIMDEVGSGIIPMEKSDREYREAVGRCGSLIASRADRVIRMVCGIPVTIKG